MVKLLKNKFTEAPASLLFIALALTGLGLITLLSISNLQSGMGSNTFLKQVAFLGPALLFFLIAFLIPERVIHKYTYLFYGFALVAVILPFLGHRVAGTYRWIQFGLPFGFQPSELAKIVVVITLARYLSDHKLQQNHFLANIIPFFIVLIPAVIVLKQPDLGTAAVMIIPVIPVLFWAGSRPYHLFLILAPIVSILAAFNVISFAIWALLMGIIMVLSRPKLWQGVSIYFGNIFLGLLTPVIWNLLKPYQQKRVLTFFNPDLDPLGAAYQIIQSKTALGSGGLLGRGWGQGTQTHLKFLPVQESDFIVSVIGEELGFITVLAMLILFIFLIWKIIKLAFDSKERFSGLVFIGIASIFLMHVFVNCAMTTGMIPVKGLPLPFISYGGSFLVTSYIMVGLCMNLGAKK